MNKIVLTADSGICAVKRENMAIIPAQMVSNNGESYSDNGTLTNKEILEGIKNNIIYKTSSPLMGDYEDVFSSALEEGNDVIHLNMSSGISAGSLNSATVVAKDLNQEYENKVYVIDTLTGATGGTLFYELAYQKLISGKYTAKKLVELLNELKTRIQTSFYVPNVEGYIRSGRDKSSSHLKDSVKLMASHFAKVAKFKFRVDFHEEGDLFLKKIFRSTDKDGMLKMVMDIVNKDNIHKFEPSLVAIGSLYKDKIDLELIKEYLLSFKYFDNIVENDIGSVVAAYGCNDLCGISLVKKK